MPEDERESKTKGRVGSPSGPKTQARKRRCGCPLPTFTDQFPAWAGSAIVQGRHVLRRFQTFNPRVGGEYDGRVQAGPRCLRSFNPREGREREQLGGGHGPPQRSFNPRLGGEWDFSASIRTGLLKPFQPPRGRGVSRLKKPSQSSAQPFNPRERGEWDQCRFCWN